MDIHFGNLAAMDAKLAHLSPQDRRYAESRIFGAASVYIDNSTWSHICDLAIAALQKGEPIEG